MRIRLTRSVTVRRTLPYGSAVHTYPAGDYNVGPEIPLDVARDALADKHAVKLPIKGERETKQRKKKRSKKVA
jgi:hypothetical protein